MKKHFVNFAVILIGITFLSFSYCQAQSKVDKSPLAVAVRNGDVATVKSLLNSGANPNLTDDQETPLALSTSL
jgi:uncharacterized membrane protein YvbJ